MTIQDIPEIIKAARQIKPTLDVTFLFEAHRDVEDFAVSFDYCGKQSSWYNILHLAMPDVNIIINDWIKEEGLDRV